jgi:hypothetical protein
VGDFLFKLFYYEAAQDTWIPEQWVKMMRGVYEKKYLFSQKFLIFFKKF